MKKELHPAVKISWRIGAYISIIFLTFFFLILDLKIFLFIIAVLIILIEIWIRLSYNRWFYEFTNDNLKIERGVILKRYSNVPYERVQNIDIRRGIIARMFGFSSVIIQTAGYSYGGARGFGSEGYIPAVSKEEAEKIRDFVMKKISKRGRSQGL